MTGKHRLDFALRSEQETTAPRAGRGWPLRLKDKVFEVTVQKLCKCPPEPECVGCREGWCDDDD